MDPIPTDLAAHALDAAPEAILILDVAGSIRFANRQVSALFGYPNASLIDRRVDMLIPERLRDRPVVGQLQHAHRQSVPLSTPAELCGQRQDGSEFPFQISLSPISAITGTWAIAVIRDTTERKAAEADLVRARQSADEARQAVERASHGKSRFLATASHDLRQPLQTLALLNGSLRRMTSNRDAYEALLQQDQAIGSMSRLLHGLLDISKIESGAIRPEPTDFAVAALFEELRREFESLAVNKDLQLQIEPSSARVRTDRSLVGQILRNLVSNAIKYTREGWVRLGCLHESSQVRILVLDTGTGIPATELPHIYEDFYRVDGANRPPDGYGLGLGIVQRLVKLLALELDVRSEVGRGSAFSLLLPTSTEPHASANSTTERRPKGKRRVGRARVLLIEDDPAVRAATRMLLTVEGYEVVAVDSLRAALEAAQGNPPFGLMIADYHLGNGETGLQAIDAIRDAVGSPIKAVLMTGDTSSSVKQLTLGPCISTASKPINADELLELLGTLLDSAPGPTPH